MQTVIAGLEFIKLSGVYVPLKDKFCYINN